MKVGRSGQMSEKDRLFNRKGRSCLGFSKLCAQLWIDPGRGLALCFPSPRCALVPSTTDRSLHQHDIFHSLPNMTLASTLITLDQGNTHQMQDSGGETRCWLYAVQIPSLFQKLAPSHASHTNHLAGSKVKRCKTPHGFYFLVRTVVLKRTAQRCFSNFVYYIHTFEIIVQRAYHTESICSIKHSTRKHEHYTRTNA